MKAIVKILLLIVWAAFPFSTFAADIDYAFFVKDSNGGGVFSFEYDGSTVTVATAMGMLPYEICALDVKGARVDNTSGAVVFYDSARKTVAGLGCNSDGSGAYIVFPWDGEYTKVTQAGRDEEFLAEFKRLKNSLSRGSASSSSSRNTTAQRPSSEGRLTARGDLTAYSLATHPIGFLPSGWRSETDIKQAMREEGWPEANGYRADLNFKVPFTLHGAEIWACGWSFNRGRLTMYSMDTYPMSGTVTEKRILTYVNKLLDSLTTNGFELLSHKVRNPGRGNMYDWNLSKGAIKVEITANSAGKVFFVVRVK